MKWLNTRRGRLWLVLSIPVWAFGAFHFSKHSETPPMGGLYFFECSGPDQLPLDQRPRPRADFCELRQDAVSEFRQERWAIYNPSAVDEAHRSWLASVRQGQPSPMPPLVPKPPPHEIDPNEMTAMERQRFYQRIVQKRDEIARRYNVDTCHLNGACKWDQPDVPYAFTNSPIYSYSTERRYPCTNEEREILQSLHERAVQKCEIARSDPERIKQARQELWGDWLHWATAPSMMKGWLIMLAPFIALLLIAGAKTIIRWIASGSK